MSGAAVSGGGGAPTLGGLGGSLEDKDCDLLCPVCFELINEAYVTRCGHSFCYACIGKAVEAHRRCPKCGAALASRDHMFPNFLLNELVARRRAARAQRPPPAPRAADTVRALVAAEARRLPLADVDAMLDLLTRRKRLLEAECAATHHRLLYEFLAQLHRHRAHQLDQVAREAALVRRDMERVADALRDLRAGAAGLADGPARAPAHDAPLGEAGDAVRALRQELAELAGSVGDTAAHADGVLNGTSAEENFASGPGGGAADALAARWRRLHAHFDDFVQCYFAHRADELYFGNSSAATPAPSSAGAALDAAGAPPAADPPPEPAPACAASALDADHVPQRPAAAARPFAGTPVHTYRRRPARARRRRGDLEQRVVRRRAAGGGRRARPGRVPRGPGGLHALPRAAPARHALLLQRRHQLLHHRVHHRVRQGRGVLRDRGRDEAHQGVRVRGGGARRRGRALPVRRDVVRAQDLVRLVERVPQERARVRRLRGHRVRVGRGHGHAHARAAGARQARVVRALQPRRRAPAGVRVGRRARQAVGAERRAVRGHAGGQVQRVLRALQPALLVPPGLRLGRPLRALLRPARAARAARRLPRPPQGRVLRQVPGRAHARLRLHGLAAEAVARGLAALRALLHRSRQREELRGAGHGRPVRGVRLREQCAVRVLRGAGAPDAGLPVRRRARLPGARAARRGALRVRVGRVLAPRARHARAAGRQQPGHHQGAGAGVAPRGLLVRA